MDIIQEVQDKLKGWIAEFNPGYLKDQRETVFVTITSFKSKAGMMGIASGQINPKEVVYPNRATGIILDKESTTHIVVASSPQGEEIYFVTITAESKRDSDMVANHITHYLLQLLRQKNLV